MGFRFSLWHFKLAQLSPVSLADASEFAASKCGGTNTSQLQEAAAAV